MNKEEFKESFISKQATCSNELLSNEINTKEEYLKHQSEIFDKFASYFSQDDEITPVEMRPAIRFIVKRFLNSVFKLTNPNDNEKTIRLLDVGCGTGILFPYMIELLQELNLKNKIHIVGIDLSNEMINQCKHRVSQLAYDKTQISFELIHGDYITWANDTKGSGFLLFDGIIMNAVFGNFYNSNEVISCTSDLLLHRGIVCISHPLEMKFQQKLHEENPNAVRYTLPTQEEFSKLLHTYPLTLTDIIEKEIDLLNDQKEVKTYELYYASLRKVKYAALENVMKFRGSVASGYGRGGKTLGVPTANLPETLFCSALEGVKTGVYFGWAVIEHKGTNTSASSMMLDGRNTCHKAVVNIGYSPTFTNKENPVKIIEAHLILQENDEELSDFYNETMRLELIGFIRPEQKFASFIELKNQIMDDIHTASIALSTMPYSLFRMDAFFSVSDDVKKNWIGNDGGDECASWEFEQYGDVVVRLPVGGYV